MLSNSFGLPEPLRTSLFSLYGVVRPSRSQVNGDRAKADPAAPIKRVRRLIRLRRMQGRAIFVSAESTHPLGRSNQGCAPNAFFRDSRITRVWVVASSR